MRLCLKSQMLRLDQEVQMSEEDLELLVTMDDPGEDTLEEDTFHNQADNTTARRSKGRDSKLIEQS